MQHRKFSRFARLALAGAAVSSALFLHPPSSLAATYTWTGTANNNWNNAGNWAGAIAPAPVADDIIDVSTLDLTAAKVFNLNNGSSNANRTAGTWIFGDTNAGGGSTFGWTVNGAAPTGSNPKLILATTSGNGTIQVNNSTTTVNVLVDGTVGLAKTGAGTLSLTNTANSFTGGIFLNAGGLTFASGTLNNNVITTGASTTLTWSGHTDDISNLIKLGDGFALTLGLSTNSADVTTFASPLQTGLLGTGSLVKGNASTLMITAAQTYTGGTTVSNGSLVLSGGDNRLSTGGAIVLGAGANSGRVQLGDVLARSDQTVSRVTLVGTGTASAIVGGNSAISTFTINNTLAATAPILGGSGTNENNLALVKSGAGALTLGKASTFIGDVSIQGGTATVSNGSALGTGTKTVTILGAVNAPSLRLNDSGAGFGLGANFSFVTGNDSTTTPAIENVGGNNVIGGSIALAAGGAGGGGTRIRSTTGSLTLSGGIAPQTNAAGSVTLALDGVSTGSATGILADNGARILGVNKAGTGTWTLSGANTYTGPTQIDAGRLNLTTAQTGGGAVTLANDAALGVSVAGVGQSLTTAALTLGTTSGTALFLDLGSVGNPTAAVITAPSFTTSTTGQSTLNINATGLSVGQFSLIDYTGTIAGGGFAGLLLGSLPARVTASLVNNTTATSVDLQITAFDLPKWTGETSAVWDFDPDGTGVGGTQNWREVTSNHLTRYLQGSGGIDSVRFDDTAGVPTNVTLSGTLTPAGVLVNTSTNAFTFGGDGRLSGATTLTKQGTSTLTLANTGGNDFTGATTISGGVIQLGDGLTAGAGQLGSGPVINNAALIFNRPDDFAFANLLSGNGVITKKGTAILTLSGNNVAYLGNITVSAGTLKVGSANALGSTAGGTTVQAGATLEIAGIAVPGEPVQLSGATISSTSGTSSLAGPVTLNGGGTVSVAAGTTTLSGAIGGAGGFVKSGAGTLVLSGTSNFAGGLKISEGSATLSGVQSFSDGLFVNTPTGTVILSANQAYTGGSTITQGTLQIGATANSTTGGLGSGGVLLNPDSGQTAALSILRGDPSYVFSTNIASSGSGTNSVNIGFAGASSLSGVVTLSGTNTFTGGVNINGGAVKIASASALGVGPKIISIQNISRPALLLDGSGGNISLSSDFTFRLSSDGASTALTQNAGGIVNLAGDNVINGPIGVTNGGGGNSKIVSNGGSLTLAGLIDANTATAVRTVIFGGTANGSVTGTIADWFDTANSANRVLSVTKADSGVWTLSGLNTFTGSLAVQEGTLKFGSIDLLGNAQPLGESSSAITIGTGTTAATLEYTGATASLSRPISPAASSLGVTIRNSGSGELTLGGAITQANATALTLAGGSINVTGSISGGNTASAIVVTGAQAKLGAPNTYLGATRVQNGATLINGASNTLPATTTLTLGEATGNTGGTYDLNGFNQTLTGLASAGTGTKIVTNRASGGSSTLTVTGTSTFDGSIQDGPTAQTALTKTTAGTLTLTGASTYTGATTVSGGTLAIKGTISGTTSLNLAGGILSVGASDRLPDTAPFTFAGGTFNAGGFSEGTVTVPGLGLLAVSATSALDFGTGSGSVLSFSGIGTHLAGTLAITNWSGTANTPGGEGDDRLIFAGLADAFQGTFLQSDVSFNGLPGYSAIQLDASHYEIVAVPEPGSISLIGMVSLLGLSGIRRRLRAWPQPQPAQIE